MKYLHKYELFLESYGNKKYEIVVFNQDYVVDNIYGGEDKIVSINIKKGEKVKLFFENNEDNEEQYVIKAIRPLEVSQNESKEIKKNSVSLSELWEANFMLTTPIIIDKDNSPFDVEDYL
jgi:hypothetical protein